MESKTKKLQNGPVADPGTGDVLFYFAGSAPVLSGVKFVVLGLDWGNGSKLTYAFVKEDGTIETRVWKQGMVSFIDYCFACGCKCIVVESTFESFNHSRRNEVIDAAAKLGVEIVTLNPRETAWYRKSHDGWQDMKAGVYGDALDAFILLSIHQEAHKHLAKPRRAVEHEATTGVQKIDKIRRDLGYRLRDPLVKEYLQYLPSFGSIPADVQECLGDARGKKYDLPFVMLTVAASLDFPRKEQFENDFGMHGHGQPGLLRSSFFRRVKTLCDRAQKNALTNLSGTSEPANGNHNPLRKEYMRKLRKTVRWVYWQVRSAVPVQLARAA